MPTEEELQKIEKWASEGMTEGSMHRALGIGMSTWWTRKKELPTIQEAIRRGKSDDEQVCMNVLRQRALDDKYRGSLTALIFYGKITFGWNDGTRVDNKPKPSSIKLREIETDANTS